MWRRRRVAADPDSISAALDAAEHHLDADEWERALRLLDDARRAAGRLAGGDWLGEVEILRAAALGQAGRFEAALEAATTACAVLPEEAAAHHERGVALYRLARFHQAARAFEEATRCDPGAAASWHALGRCALWLGDEPRARPAFARAARLQPDVYVVPVRVAAAEFDRLAAAAWERIPGRFRRRLGDLIVAVEPLPAVDDVAEGFDPDTLGVYEGATALASEAGLERIVLFQHNIENVCHDLGTLREEIRRTLLHEVGHHFGMEEDELPF